MAAPVTALVADDEPDVRDFVTLRLQQAGFDVRAVGDGVATLAALRERKPDILLLDIMMPGRSGLEVLKEMRADADLKDVLVILLTAKARDKDVDDGYAAGADDYISKPFSPRELIHRVNSLLSRGR